MYYNISADGYKGFRYLNNLETTRSKAVERLSSGYRINHTSDDAAGASMSVAMRSQIRGLTQAFQNSEDMIGLLNTAESSIGAMTEMLQRIRELSVRAASDTNTTEDRMYMQQEVDQLLKELERFSKDTEFNGITLFNNDPDVAGKTGGLAAVLGVDHITPNGNLSESYGTWNILDKAENGENATPNTYKTIVTRYTEYTAYSSEYTYTGFWMSGSFYTGDLYDSSGKKIGEMQPDNTLTLDAAGKTILPDREDNKSGYRTPTTQENSTTYTPAGTATNTLGNTSITVAGSVGAGSSGVYGKDSLGNLVALSYTRNEKITGNEVEHVRYADYSTKHIAATINFEDFNKNYSKVNLYDTGFNSTCATCSNHYSIKFVKGDTNEVTRNGSHYTLNVGIDVLDNKSTGKDLAELVVNALKECEGTQGAAMINHYTQYAYKDATLYIFDQRSGRPGNSDTFQAEVYGEPIKAVSRKPLVYAQVGSNTDDRIAIELPYISLETLKLQNVNLTTREGATDALGKMDETILFLTKERAKLSLWGARISHSASNADMGAYNHTLSESKVMDTDYADEVLQLSKSQVLTEFGISSVSEVQKLIENVLQFIG